MWWIFAARTARHSSPAGWVEEVLHPAASIMVGSMMARGQCVKKSPGKKRESRRVVQIRELSGPGSISGPIFIYIGAGEPPALPPVSRMRRPGNSSSALTKGVWPCNYFSQLERRRSDPYPLHASSRRGGGSE